MKKVEMEFIGLTPDMEKSIYTYNKKRYVGSGRKDGLDIVRELIEPIKEMGIGPLGNPIEEVYLYTEE